MPCIHAKKTISVNLSSSLPVSKIALCELLLMPPLVAKITKNNFVPEEIITADKYENKKEMMLPWVHPPLSPKILNGKKLGKRHSRILRHQHKKEIKQLAGKGY